MYKELFDQKRVGIGQMLRQRRPVFVELGFTQSSGGQDFIFANVQDAKAVSAMPVPDVYRPDVTFVRMFVTPAERRTHGSVRPLVPSPLVGRTASR